MVQRNLPLAHVMGTMDRPEKLPGLDDRERGNDRRDAYRPFEREQGNVMVRMSTDPAREPLRQFLVATVHSCQELWDLCRRLGLPRTSALTKAPFSREAFAHPERVTLSMHQQRMLAARASGDLYRTDLAWRPGRPRDRTKPPGLPAVILANALLVWLTISIGI
ncbi:hypothetical protein WJX81_008620 [Elliptochloris bilobata]|uniref:Uncharacterized protein n=1 Tax=Elliptochloris bilobata TaxID=381761 RepID=A0AAW1RQN3_9CHLO